jgi:hypothetical protein
MITDISGCGGGAKRNADCEEDAFNIAAMGAERVVRARRCKHAAAGNKTPLRLICGRSELPHMVWEHNTLSYM